MNNHIESGHSLNSSCTEEDSPPASSHLAGVDSGAPAPLPIPHPSLKSSTKNKPALDETPSFTLPLHEWVGILQKEYLATFIREGGGAVKVAVFPHDHLLQICQQAMDNAAKCEGYLVAKIDARFTKIHLVERLFQKIAKQMDWDELAYRFVWRLLEENGYHLPENRKEFTLRNLAALNERKEHMLRRDVQAWVEKAIEADAGLCREFRMAMIRLCMAQLDAGDSDRLLASAVKEWLCGDLRLVSGVKKAMIYQKISRHNARHMLSSFIHWVRLTGRGGLLLSLDISRYFSKHATLPPDGSLSFTSSATMDLFELLRQFIDSAGEVEGLLMVVLAPKEFLTDPRRGVGRYEALQLRVTDDLHLNHHQNPLNPLVRIQDASTMGVVDDRPSHRLNPRILVPENEARRVIEGLRSGVPNRHVVTALGCLQPEVEGRFRRLLEATQQNATAGACPRGMVIEGEFGSGKSHILEYLHHLALEANFICSRIVISKETPLYHPGRLYYSAIESAEIPNKRGEVFAEIAGECDVWTPRYKDLVGWVNNPENRIDARFAATLMLYERLSTDLDLGHRMTRFWTGDPIGVGELKKYLHEAGFGDRFTFGTASASELALQRFQFAARLMQAAGYAGWILLIDEAELIGRYSVNQRAKSYAEIARLMNVNGGPPLPGLGTILALTHDFREDVLEKKGDKVKLLHKLRAKQSEADCLLADHAEKGMAVLLSQRIPIGQPPTTVIQDAYRAIRALHFKGHGWRPWENAMEEPAAIIPGMSMRKYVKSWVTHWDTLRFSHGGEEDEREAKTWYPASLEKEKTGTTNSGENGHSSHPAPTPQETSILNAEGKEILGSEISAEPVPSPLFIQ